MQAIAVITHDDFEAALAAAREVDTLTVGGGLAAPLGAGLGGRVDALWDRVEDALVQAYEWGREKAQEALADAVAETEALLVSVGRQASAVHQAMMKRVTEYLTKLIDRALATVRPAVSVGKRTLELVGVEISQSVSLSGSLKASITDLVNLTASGQLVVHARYGPGGGG
ncbi:hypothetical protein AB0H77_31330 [Streptomyces sp. NPDC050844]|uniref:hypothetical protein n=1 Tax=Streptomyces sp. NPDC050844 TaxID=3155790 RepID=UPI0033C0F754